MIDTPEPADHNSHSDGDLQPNRSIPQASDPTPPSEEEKQTKQYRHYSQYIVRPFKAIWRGFLACVDWLDAKDGFVTAVATVVTEISLAK